MVLDKLMKINNYSAKRFAFWIIIFSFANE